MHQNILAQMETAKENDSDISSACLELTRLFIFFNRRITCTCLFISYISIYLYSIHSSQRRIRGSVTCRPVDESAECCFVAGHNSRIPPLRHPKFPVSKIPRTWKTEEEHQDLNSHLSASKHVEKLERLTQRDCRVSAASACVVRLFVKR